MGLSLWDKWPNGKMAKLLNEGREADLRFERGGGSKRKDER